VIDTHDAHDERIAELEAEVTRVTQVATAHQMELMEKDREVERLTAIIEANDNYDQEATEREVERLRAEKNAANAECMTWRKAAGAAGNRMHVADAEVKRLRAAHTKMAQDWLDYYGPAKSGSGMGAADEKARLADGLNDAALAALAKEETDLDRKLRETDVDDGHAKEEA
jgi:chromosome segregation ATPase